MSIAITFRDQPEHKRHGDEHSYSSLSRREAESLPHYIELETTALLNHESLCGVLLRLLVRCCAGCLPRTRVRARQDVFERAPLKH